ncbi:MAG: hypothetical protein ACRDYY_16700 [Acidimicrobiales bacterium]
MTQSWCHGDLWPVNIVLRRRKLLPVVLDWECARRDSPSGLDAVMLEIGRVKMSDGISFGEAAASMLLCGSDGRLSGVEVGGRGWREWGTVEKQAILTAAVVHYLAEKRDIPSSAWLHWCVAPYLAALRGAS